MLSYRRFDREDWAGWAGAEKFHGGYEPIVAGDDGGKGGAFSVEGLPALVIAGGSGVEVYFGEELEMHVRRDPVIWTVHHLDVLLLLEKMEQRMSLEDLRKLGFRVDVDELIEQGDYVM